MPHKSNIDRPIRWNLLLRYQLIEIIALWEGRITSKTLISAYSIGRQQASNDINIYNTSVAPNNLVYDKHLKGYKPDLNFKPVLTKGSIDEYMHLINTRKDLSTHFTALNIEQTNTEVIFSPARFIVPEYHRLDLKELVSF